jgi:hypothetical protein
MLQLKSSDLKALTLPHTAAATMGGTGLSARGAGTMLVSTSIGAGLLYVGMKKKGWWHIATALGATNLLYNGADIVDRIV